MCRKIRAVFLVALILLPVHLSYATSVENELTGEEITALNDAYKEEFERRLVQYEYGDQFEVPLFDSAGNEVPLPAVPKLLIYTSASCGTCITLLSQTQPLFEIFGSEYFQVFNIWLDDIPTDMIEMRNIPLSRNLSSYGVHIGGMTPTMYLVDENNMVIFRDYDMNRVVEKIFDLDYLPEGYLRQQADRYLISRLDTVDNKTPLLYFTMTGCPDCEAADNIINDNPDIEDRFSITKLYRYNEMNPENWTDHFKFFVRIYHINWYPSFMVFEDGASRLYTEIPENAIYDTVFAPAQ